jgi:cytochrome c2
MSAGGLGFATYTYERAQDRYEQAARLTGGNPAHGEEWLIRFGCTSCHTIPGLQRADGLVGPDLGQFSRRLYIAGRLENSPDNLTRWIVDPRAVDPRTAMPRTGISKNEARDIAAYLYAMP